MIASIKNTRLFNYAILFLLLIGTTLSSPPINARSLGFLYQNIDSSMPASTEDGGKADFSPRLPLLKESFNQAVSSQKALSGDMPIVIFSDTSAGIDPTGKKAPEGYSKLDQIEPLLREAGYTNVKLSTSPRINIRYILGFPQCVEFVNYDYFPIQNASSSSSQQSKFSLWTLRVDSTYLTVIALSPHIDPISQPVTFNAIKEKTDEIALKYNNLPHNVLVLGDMNLRSPNLDPDVSNAQQGLNTLAQAGFTDMMKTLVLRDQSDSLSGLNERVNFSFIASPHDVDLGLIELAEQGAHGDVRRLLNESSSFFGEAVMGIDPNKSGLFLDEESDILKYDTPLIERYTPNRITNVVSKLSLIDKKHLYETLTRRASLAFPTALSYGAFGTAGLVSEFAMLYMHSNRETEQLKEGSHLNTEEFVLQAMALNQAPFPSRHGLLGIVLNTDNVVMGSADANASTDIEQSDLIALLKSHPGKTIVGAVFVVANIIYFLSK